MVYEASFSWVSLLAFNAVSPWDLGTVQTLRKQQQGGNSMKRYRKNVSSRDLAIPATFSASLIPEKVTPFEAL